MESTEHKLETELPHPRPQMRRERWSLLNGDWEFCNGRGKLCSLPGEVEWDAHILVPVSPETEASGIGDTGFYSAGW